MERLYLNHLSRIHQFEQSGLLLLQLLLGARGSRAGAGRGNRGSGRRARGGADGCNGRGRGGAGGCTGRDLASSLGGSGRSVLSSLASRAGSTGSRLGCNGSERGGVGRGRDGAGRGDRGGRDSTGASTGRGRAERGLSLLRSEAELVQSVVVVVAETSVGVVSSLSVVVAGRGGGSAVSAGSLVLDVVARKTSRVLASESSKLVTLATLGNGDAVLVEPLLDLAVRPAVKKLVGKALLSRGGLLGGRIVPLVGLLSSDVRVATDGSDERVTVAGLRDGNTTLIAPSLQVRVGPLSVEPRARVGSGLAGLVCHGLVVGADSREQRVTSARLGVGDAVVVEEGLELRLSPARCALADDQVEYEK